MSWICLEMVAIPDAWQLLFRLNPPSAPMLQQPMAKSERVGWEKKKERKTWIWPAHIKNICLLSCSSTLNGRKRCWELQDKSWRICDVRSTSMTASPKSSGHQWPCPPLVKKAWWRLGMPHSAGLARFWSEGKVLGTTMVLDRWYIGKCHVKCSISA